MKTIKYSSGSDCDLQDLLHSIIDLNRKTTTSMLNQTNALIKLSSLQQELNASIIIITQLQKEVSDKLMELRPLTFEAQFLKSHLNSSIRIDTSISSSKIEDMQIYVKDFLSSIPNSSFQQEVCDHLPDFGSDHELALAKIANQYKSYDTNSLKYELYTKVYNAELQRLEIASSRVEKITSAIVMYQHKIKESVRIRRVFSEWLVNWTKEIQMLTDVIISLRKLRNEIKREVSYKSDDSDDDGYHTPPEDCETFN